MGPLGTHWEPSSDHTILRGAVSFATCTCLAYSTVQTFKQEQGGGASVQAQQQNKVVVCATASATKQE